MVGNTWKTDCCKITEKAYDYDCHIFAVENLNGKCLGNIYPADADASAEIVAKLDAGACPICDGWEDGNGHTCTLDGWQQC